MTEPIVEYTLCRNCDKKHHMIGHIFCLACFLECGGYISYSV
jgi:hypothetical protein